MRDVWLGLLLLAAPSALWAHEPPDKKTTAVPLYTNSDLERVAPFRDQTGVASVPGPGVETARATSKDASPLPVRGRGETYWRHEADRVRQRVRKLEAQAATVRSRIEAEKARPPRGKSAKHGPDLEARLAALRLEARQLEDELLDRARRDRAFPGWLR